MIDWKAFYENGGYINENSDPDSYDDGEDEESSDFLDKVDECWAYRDDK